MLFISGVCKRNGCEAGNCTAVLLLPSLNVTARFMLPLSVSLPVCCVAAGYFRPHRTVCFNPGVTAASVLQKDSTLSSLRELHKKDGLVRLQKKILGEGPLVNLSASGCHGHPGNTSQVMFRGNLPLCYLSSSPVRQDSPTSSIRHCSGAP